MKLFTNGILIIIAALLFWGCISPDLRSARIAMNETDWERAKMNLEKELAVNPDNAEALWRMGLCYENLEDWAKMSEYYDKSLSKSELFKDKIQKSRSMLVARYIRNLDSLETEKALARLDIATVIDPGEIILYQNGAIIAYNDQQFNKAIEYAKKTIEIEKVMIANGEGENLPDISVRQVLLEANTQLGNEKEALVIAHELMSLIDPQTERDTYLRSLDAVVKAYEKVENFEKAIEFVIAAVELFPETVDLRKNLGILYDRSDQSEKAKQTNKAVLKQNPEDFDVCNWLGYKLLSEEKYTETIPYLETSHRLKPDEVGVIQNLMRAYFETEQDGKGQEMAEKLRFLSSEESLQIDTVMPDKLIPAGKDFYYKNVTFKSGVVLGSVRVIGEMQNKSGKTFTVIWFRISAFDVTGKLLEVDNFSINDFEKGTTRSFEANLTDTIVDQVASYKIQVELDIED